ncbi:hypothetical protein J6590_058754 [Homalodisca vitripennis]|nr:hypothetical protein J6590_058754 [Homalodisca vitripennis]
MSLPVQLGHQKSTFSVNGSALTPSSCLPIQNQTVKSAFYNLDRKSFIQTAYGSIACGRIKPVHSYLLAVYCTLYLLPTLIVLVCSGVNLHLNCLRQRRLRPDKARLLVLACCILYSLPFTHIDRTCVLRCQPSSKLLTAASAAAG